jgi:hypothetical protein
VGTAAVVSTGHVFVVTTTGALYEVPRTGTAHAVRVEGGTFTSVAANGSGDVMVTTPATTYWSTSVKLGD